jgi:hypothetical protein
MREFLGEYFGLLGPSGRAELPEGGPARGGRDVGTAKAGGGKKGGGDERMSIWRDELRQQLQDERNFLSDSKEEELKYWQGKLAIVGNGTKEDLKLRREVNSQIFTLEKELAKQAESQSIEFQSYAQKTNDVLLGRKRAQIQADVALGRISEQEGIAGEKALVEAKIQADFEYYDKKRQAAEGDRALQRKLARKNRCFRSNWSARSLRWTTNRWRRAIRRGRRSATRSPMRSIRR